MKHYEIRISGRVQGVTFRWSTQQKAKKIGIYGFVENSPDGGVYIEAEGESDSLNEFLARCRKGPIFARVDNVMFEEKPIVGYNKFEIK